MQRPLIKKLQTAKTREQWADYWTACREKLNLFTAQTFFTVDPGAKYKHNWHIDCMSEHLEAVTRREIKRLIINVPPGYLKSICVNVAWPAWLLGHNPSERIMSASYSQSLSYDMSAACRLVIQSDWYKRLFPHVILAGDQNAKEKYYTTARGMRFAVSVGGTATGSGGNILILDDPLNPKQALSETERENANTWFDQTYATRLRDMENGAIVLIMQRLHARDLTGHLLAKGGWQHLCLPAIAEERQTITYGPLKKVREIGEALHPERQDIEAIKAKEIELGPYAFAAQYQQRPAPLGGGILKRSWFKSWTKKDAKGKIDLPECDLVIQVYDTAFKEGQENDYTARLTFGIFSREDDKGNQIACLILLEIFNERMDFPKLREEAQRSYKEYNPDYVIIEDKASGQSLIQELRKMQVPVIPFKMEGDKVYRAHASTPTLAQGCVYIPEGLPKAEAFISQCELFPNAEHDDMTDCLTAGVNWLRRRFRVVIPQDHHPEDNDTWPEEPAEIQSYGNI